MMTFQKRLLKGRQKVLNGFESTISPIGKQKQGQVCPLDLARVAKVCDLTRLKILTPKQMLQRLLITLAQVKAGNTSENLLNEIRQTIYSLQRAHILFILCKDITKKVYINIMNSIKL